MIVLLGGIYPRLDTHLNTRLRNALPLVAVALVLTSAPHAMAQTAPPLGVLQQFSVLGGSAATGSAGAGTTVNGDVGSSPTDTVNNFPPSSVTMGFFVRRVALGDGPLLIQARNDATAAFVALNQMATMTLPSNLAGQTLTSGVYDFTGGTALLAAGGTLTLNGGGIFVFRTGSELTTINTSNVTGTANPCNVFWQVGSSATIDSANFLGNVFASASITVTGNLTGKAIAGTGAVTMPVGGNTIGGCVTAGAPPPTPTPAPIPPVPALPDFAAAGLLAALVVTGVVLARR